MLNSSFYLSLLTFLMALFISACGSDDVPATSDATAPASDAADSSDATDSSDAADPADMSESSDPSEGAEPPCTEAVADASYKVWPGEDWETTCPEVQNIDSVKLQEAYDYAFAPGRNTQSVVVVRNGAIVAEWYAAGKTKDDHVTSWSVAKSFLSAVVGIAVARGDLPSADESLATYIPEFQGTDKEAITFRHALQMRSGLEEHAPDNIYIQTDQLAYGIERDVAEAPGGTWAYQNGDSMLVSRGLEAALGTPFIEYANEVLLEPIGIDAKWWTDSVGNALGYCCLDATARDFARFGLLFSRNGDWNPSEIVPAAWVAESTTPVGADMPYGLHWWAFDNGLYYAAIGARSQSIWVFPYFDLVVLRNGLYDKRGDPEDYRVIGGSYHDTPEPSEWEDGDFLAPIFEALNDNPLN